MRPPESFEAELRRVDASFKMRHARKRYRSDVKAGAHGGASFRVWAKRTYNAFACSGKLARLANQVAS